MIYLDHAATSPLLPEVAAAMAEWVGVPANPSSAHAFGRRAAAALERARVEVALLLGRDPAGIVFVSGATEANHTAILGVARGGVAGARRALVSPIEHPSVFGALDRAGLEIERMAIGSDGIARVPDATDADLVALAAVNHEIGTVQPVRALRGPAWTHVDATQAAGRVPLEGLDVDSIAISAHKLGGPVGVGALSLRGGEPFPALLTGGSQERGRRAGTVDVAGAVGMAVACRIARTRPVDQVALAERLRAGLVELGGRIVGHRPIPAITTAVFGDLPGDLLVQALDLRGIAVSSGAACASGSVGPSPVLLALGDPNPRGGLRMSLGPSTTAAEIEALLRALRDLLPTARAARAWEIQSDESP